MSSLTHPLGTRVPAGISSVSSLYQQDRRRGNLIIANFTSAVEALWANRLRSLLTTLGVIFGVMAVIAAVTITEGTRSLINGTIANLGPNVLIITSGTAIAGGAFAAVGSDQSLTVSDAQRMVKVEHVLNVSPLLNVNAQVLYSNQNWNTYVHGVYPNLQLIQHWSLAKGIWFSAHDELSAAPVAVIGQVVASNLFDKTRVDPVGQIISIRGQHFQVIGVLQAKGASVGGFNQDDVVFIPFTTAHTRLKNSTYIDQIQVQVDDADHLDPVQSIISALLKMQHHLSPSSIPDFQIRSPNEIKQISQQFTQALTFLLGGIAAISLTVGGIGIMNIMLVSVTERTREIGIRMALGARRRDIRNQFLIEATTLSIVGGVIGILIGSALGLVLTIAFQLPFALNLFTILLASGVSTVVGVVFGLYPAVRASRLDPIVALRTE